MSDPIVRGPGLLAGVYPQREEMRQGLLESTLASVSGKLRQHAFGRKPRFRRFVATVADHGQLLDGLTGAELDSRIAAVRRSLRAFGLRTDAVSLSFALIRECASRRLGLRHFDVQLYGGWVMLQGMIAEMDTGEGKTLTATLAAGTAAMAGIPVHIVTVNDFLAARDAQWMMPVYRALGLTVGVVTEGLSDDERRRAYRCDITYCTNKQLVFDYLRDRMILGQENRQLHLNLEELHAVTPRVDRLLLRGLSYAIVDEADSVLVDEARTPLVISKRNSSADFDETYRQAIGIARLLQAPRDFVVRSSDRRIRITELGEAQVRRMGQRFGGIWAGTRHATSLVRQALSSLHLFHRDQHYLIRDGRVVIVDEFTGRVMADRSWEQGLHQMLEAKEGCEITGRNETLARLSYQRFFQRYHRLSGMTGTAREVSSELWSTYRINVVTIPTNRPSLRTELRAQTWRSAENKWRAVVESVLEMHRRGRPVLVGTRSVAASERIALALEQAGLEFELLNARQDQAEAQIIAQAGRPGQITVATNMAGRGTDVRLAPGVAELGGLHVIATERHEAARIDRQLFGRCGRQGDPGSCQAMISLEDELFDGWFGRRLRSLAGSSELLDERIGSRTASWLVRFAQWLAESDHRRARRQLMRLDQSLSDILAFTGRGE
jgi:preprotein translocase subunit SecA